MMYCSLANLNNNQVLINTISSENSNGVGDSAPAVKIADIDTEKAATVIMTQDSSHDDDVLLFTEPNSMDVALERPFRIGSFPGNVADSWPTPFKKWFDQMAVQSRLVYYRYTKFDLTIRLSVSTSPYNYGKAIFAYVPFAANPDGIIDPTYQELASTPYSVIVDYSRSNTYEITIPWHEPYFAHDKIKESTSSCPWDQSYLFFVPIYGPLSSANTGGVAGTMSCVLSYQARNVQYFLPSVDPQMGKTEKPQKSEGVISGPAKVVSTVAGALSGIPFLAPFAVATQMAADAVGGIASLFGFSNPPILAPTKAYSTNANCRSLIDVTYPGGKLSLTGNQELGFAPNPFDGNVDVMTNLSIARRWGVFGTATFTNTTAVGAGFAYEVRPNLPLATPTPLDLVSSFHRYWRGSIEFGVEICSNSFHRGRIAVIWSPTIMSLPITLEDVVGINPIYVMDLAVGNKFNFTVPYLSDKDWLLTASCGSATQTDWASTNGYIHFVVYSEIVAPTAGINPSIKCIIFGRGGEDIEFAVQDNNYVNAICDERYSGAWASFGDFSSTTFPTLDAAKFFKAGSGNTIPGSVVAQIGFDEPIVLGNFKMDDSNRVKRTIGEPYVSTRQLCKRPSIAYVPNLETTGSHAIIVPTGPRGHIRFKNATDAYIKGWSSPLTRLAEVFGGWRGTMRYCISGAADATNMIRTSRVLKCQSPQFINISGYSGLDLAGVIASSAGYNEYSERDITTPNTVAVRRREWVDVPYYRPYMYDKCEPHTVRTEWVRDAVAFVGVVGTTAGPVIIEQAIGEDFQFMIWNYIPTKSLIYN